MIDWSMYATLAVQCWALVSCLLLHWCGRHRRRITMQPCLILLLLLNLILNEPFNNVKLWTKRERWFYKGGEGLTLREPLLSVFLVLSSDWIALLIRLK